MALWRTNSNNLSSKGKVPVRDDSKVELTPVRNRMEVCSSVGVYNRSVYISLAEFKCLDISSENEVMARWTAARYRNRRS